MDCNRIFRAKGGVAHRSKGRTYAMPVLLSPLPEYDGQHGRSDVCMETLLTALTFCLSFPQRRSVYSGSIRLRVEEPCRKLRGMLSLQPFNIFAYLPNTTNG
jgi:hypothetical protein